MMIGATCGPQPMHLMVIHALAFLHIITVYA
jgi:hypothetical protein